jgi:hypothetical protein
VSVVIPTYNRWPMVADALESALEQQGAAVEVIVVDDGSRDGTADLLSARYPSVTVIRQANAERGAARNRGAVAARGSYLCFLDADDVLERWHVSQFAQHLDSCHQQHLQAPSVAAAPAVLWNPATGSCCTPRRLRLHHSLPLAEAALLGTVLPLQGLFVESGAFRASGGFPVERRIATNEDWVFLARLACRFSVAHLARASVRIREHPGRSMADVEQARASRLAAVELVLAQGLCDRPLDERQRRLVVAGAHHFCAAMSYQAGEMGRARAHLRRAAVAIGRRDAVPLCGRLWAQSWVGRRASLLARRARNAVTGIIAGRGP